MSWNAKILKIKITCLKSNSDRTESNVNKSYTVYFPSTYVECKDSLIGKKKCCFDSV